MIIADCGIVGLDKDDFSLSCVMTRRKNPIKCLIMSAPNFHPYLIPDIAKDKWSAGVYCPVDLLFSWVLVARKSIHSVMEK